MNKLWKKFKSLTSQCYTNMVRSETDMSVWDETFSVLAEIVNEDRKTNSDFGKELYQLDEITDYQFDVSGWLDDYLDELDMYERYARLQTVCEQLIQMFRWEEESPSDLRFHIASAMSAQGRKEESLHYCESWRQEEPDNTVAAVSLIYAKIAVKDLKGAEDVVNEYISEDTSCTEENDIVFTAAECLYKANGNKKALKRISQAMKKYEKELEEYFQGWEDDEFGMEEELPFN